MENFTNQLGIMLAESRGNPFRSEDIRTLFLKSLARQLFAKDDEWKGLLRQAYGEQVPALEEQISRLASVPPQNFTTRQWNTLLYGVYSGDYDIEPESSAMVLYGRRHARKTLPHMNSFAAELTKAAPSMPLVKDMLYIAALCQNPRVEKVIYEDRFQTAQAIDFNTANNALRPLLYAQLTAEPAVRAEKLAELATVLPHLGVDFGEIGIQTWAEETHARYFVKSAGSDVLSGSGDQLANAKKKDIRKEASRLAALHDRLQLTADRAKLSEPLFHVGENAVGVSRTFENLSKKQLEDTLRTLNRDIAALQAAQLDNAGLITKARNDTKALKTEWLQLLENADRGSLYASEQHLALEWSCPKNIDRLSQLEAEQTALTLASHIAVLRKNQIQQ